MGVILLAAALLAQSTASEAPAETAADAAGLPKCASGVVPALTPITLATARPLGTKINKEGDLFRMVLVEPIVLGVCVAIPAGAAVTAEVINSKKSEFWGGTGGEFIAAARFMEVGERKLRLRSLTLSTRGADKMYQFPSGTLLGQMFNRVESGKKAVEIPAGTVYEAKTAEAFELAPQLPVPERPASPAP